MQAKVAKNFKFAPVKGTNTVCLKQYGKDGEVLRISTPIRGAKMTPHGPVVRTESGTIWLVRPEDRIPGIWVVGLQTRRPEVYRLFQEKGVL